MNIVIWGSGSAALEFLDIAKHNDINVLAHVDNNRLAWGKEINGKPVLSPGKLNELQFDRLIICSVYHEDIIRQIRRVMGDKPLPISVYARGYTGDNSVFHEFTDIPFDCLKWSILQFSTLSKCNLFCAHCFRSNETAAGEYELSVEHYTNILSRFNPKQFAELCMSEDGEISLLKDYKAMFTAVRDLGWQDIQFVTNGTSSNADFFNYILEMDIVSKLIVSLEAVDPAMFKRIRGYSFDRYKSFVAMINDLRRKHFAKAEFMLSSCCMKENFRQLPGIVSFAADNGFSHIGFVPLVTGGPQVQPNKLLDDSQGLDRVDIGLKREIYAETVEIAKKRRISVCLPEIIDDATDYGTDTWKPHNNRYTCSLPFTYVSVGHTGNIYPCCKMPRQYPLGNVLENTFEEVWNGPGYRHLLKGLGPNGTLPKSCVGCTVTKGYAW